MDYRIEKPGAIKVICKREAVHKPETGAGTPDIREFWAKCGHEGDVQGQGQIEIQAKLLL